MDNTRLSDFDDIRPYEPSEMKQAFNDLINDRQFSLMLKGFVPWMPKGVRNGLLRLAFTGVKTPLDFQKRFMNPIVKYLIRKHTDGCTFDHSALSEQPTADNKPLTARYTFLSNHRDIVLDSAFLDVMLIASHYPTTVEIGIGDNLLIYPWIKRLVRMNKAFTVHRGLTAHEMLAMGGDLRELNIIPLTISYEYDPCDYLKAQEFQLKRDNPDYRKSRQDDLDNMKTGIVGYKGRVHYHCAPSVNTWIDELAEMPRNEYFASLSQRIDNELHRHYRLYPCNYIALDLLEGQRTYAEHYTPDDEKRFEQYLQGQLAKVTIPNADTAFLRERMLTMYANPLRNYLKVKG